MVSIVFGIGMCLVGFKRCFPGSLSKIGELLIKNSFSVEQAISYCVRGARTHPLICVGCYVHYWVPCAINKGGFFEIAFVVIVDTHLPRFEALA